MTENQIDKTTGYLILTHNGIEESISPETKVKFLQLMADRWNVGHCCKQLGIHRDSIYRHLELDKQFKLDYTRLFEDVNDQHESVISDCSLKSKNFVASLAWLKAHRPLKWREKTFVQTNEQTNDDKLKLLLKLAESWPVNVVKQDASVASKDDQGSTIDAEVIPNTPENNLDDKE